MLNYDPIRLEIYKHLFAAVAEEMGVVLRKASYSPNIKERRDYSCAIFNAQGDMISQAAHIPVHLGSMPLSVKAALDALDDLSPGDAILLNDPFRGGTHLPDITLVSPVFVPIQEKSRDGDVQNGRRLFGFVASRAHHADVGGIAAGSMPVASEIFQEGLIIPPVRIFRRGVLQEDLLAMILANVRTPLERQGDLWAQIAANQRGVERLEHLVLEYGEQEAQEYMGELLAYTERMTRWLIQDMPDGEYSFEDYLDDDGITGKAVPIRVTITIQNDNAVVDFSNSARQCRGSVNAVYAITLSAVFYVFRCLLALDVPNNGGCLKPIKIIAPSGSVVNANSPAAVAGGNVETSQRIVDVLLGALANAYPERVPAASQGTMNNLTIGGLDLEKDHPFTYYETIAGGMGARPDADGVSGMHSHMTNTLNTPIEALEYAYPLQVVRYEIRRGSGGSGHFRGGDGIRRDVQLLAGAQVTLLTERRKFAPYGLKGGKPGKPGENVLIRGNDEILLSGKGTFEMQPGDVISIRTPGGGGYGE